MSLGSHYVSFVQQTDATYMRNLDGLVPSLCALAREHGEDKRRLPIRAAALQALAAMVLAISCILGVCHLSLCS